MVLRRRVTMGGIITRNGLGVGSFMKLFYTGPVINTEMLVVMLEKHGINATHEVLAGESTDEEDLNRTAHVLVPEADFDRAYQLFYAEREDEL